MSEKKHELILAALGLILVGIIIICAAFDMPGLSGKTEPADEVIVITTGTDSSERFFENEESAQKNCQDNNIETESVININTATFEELTGINRIGPERADAIIEYREQFGNFDSVEEITNIYGIGEDTLEEIRDYITAE